MEWDAGKPWYHGSPIRLSSIRAGSTITQDRELARVFSHKPTLVVQDVDDVGRRSIKHTGEIPGFLYRVGEEVRPEDIYPHPETTMAPSQEWLTTRELCVELIGPTEIVVEEALTTAEIEELRHKLAESQRTRNP